jgi:hypothetical protein
MDPIGIAGGLNVYGFAGGDPINFSDPFGLCPYSETGVPCTVVFAAAGITAGAAYGMAAGATGGTVVAPVFGTILIGGGGAVTGALLGGVGGALAGAAIDIGPTAAIGAKDLLRWGRRKTFEIGLRIGQAIAGAEGSSQILEERLRQQQAQEQLEEEQKPDPTGGQ